MPKKSDETFEDILARGARKLAAEKAGKKLKTLGHILYDVWREGAFFMVPHFNVLDWEKLAPEAQQGWEDFADAIDFEPHDGIKTKQGWNPDFGWNILPG